MQTLYIAMHTAATNIASGMHSTRTSKTCMHMLHRGIGPVLTAPSHRTDCMLPICRK